MAQRGDIIVYDRYGKLIAVAVVKSWATPELAASVRDELRLYTGSPYAVVVSREQMYIWSPGNDEPVIESTARLLNPYLEQIGRDVVTVTTPALQAVLHIWLSDVANERPPAIKPAAPEFVEAIADGAIRFQDAA